MTTDAFKKHIFWVESCENHEDCFVVSFDQYLAEKFFVENQGYDFDLVSSEDICIAEFEDEEDIKEESYYPSHEMLVKNGFEIITENEPSIFWKEGRKYCQGNIMHRVIIQAVNNKSGVYLIEVRDSGLFKIGVTKNIEKRLSQLQTSNPYEFNLKNFFVTAQHRQLENLLHKKFQLNRYKREWFKLNSDVIEVERFASAFIGKPYKVIKQEDTERIQNESELNKNSDLPF
jgi:predicted GIY-YIG superfamily endonuclease